ncbi:MAG: MerR family transcriptional regulator [Dermatophilaceae bacterium]
MTEGTQVATSFSVGQVAEMFGVTVRTLHHYDEIGLLVPSGRSRAGYRRYTEDDGVRLQQIVVYRRLQFPLEQIATLLAGQTDVVGHLRRQRDAVMTRLDEMRDLVVAIDKALERAMSNQPATTEDLKELFGDGFNDDYQQEAQERWGDSDAWKESARRTKGYSKADWARIKAEGEASGAALVAALQSGEPATSVAAMDAAEAHRQHIDRWFYPCSYGMHRGLADMYMSDARFTNSYEEMAPGLAQYVRDAIHANADRHES